jgi:RNA polymerase sigma-70 factor (ECF subfamily)
LDIEVVSRAISGDQDAFAAIAGTHVDQLYAVAFRICRDASVAEDATQRALLEMWRHVRDVRSPDRFERWSYRVLVRACYQELRGQRRWHRALEAIPSRSTLDDESEAVIERDVLRQAFRRVPMEQRAVIVLHHYVDLPFPRIAEILQIPIGTVRSRLFYGMRSLRGALEANERLASEEQQA